MGGSVSKGGSAEVVRPPPSAAYFRLTRVFLKGEGKGKKAKVTGEPLADGTVPDRWDVSEFSPGAILATFGPDKYRVDWYEADDTRLGSRTFAVAVPTQAGAARIAPRSAPRARRRDRDEELDPDEEPRRGASESMSFREFLAMQAEDRREAERREERADQRRREEAAVAQQRDREFMATVLGALMQQRSTPVESNDLLRREISLELRQGLARLREELGGEEEPDDPNDPPSIEGVGQAVLGELEARAPHLVGELIPQVAQWLKDRGFVPSPQVQQAIAARTQQNGRGSAGPG